MTENISISFKLTKDKECKSFGCMYKRGFSSNVIKHKTLNDIKPKIMYFNASLNFY